MSIVDLLQRSADDEAAWREASGLRHGRSMASGLKDTGMPSNAQATTVGGESPVPAAFLAACEPSTLWELLTHASGNRVTVFDAEGRVVYANAALNAEYASRAGKGSVVGLMVDDYTPPEFAAEWKGFIRRALQEQRPMIVEGMIHGFRYRAHVNPVGSGSTGYVLVVSRNIAELPAGEAVVRNGMDVIQAKANDLGVLAELTEREMEVLELIGEGLSTAEVAKRLDRSVKTVEWHRAALGSKLGITNRVELARIAIGAGLCRAPSAKAGRRKVTARAS